MTDIVLKNSKVISIRKSVASKFFSLYLSYCWSVYCITLTRCLICVCYLLISCNSDELCVVSF